MWGIFVLETALTVITTRVTYTLLCEGWGDPNALTRLTKVDAFIPVIAAFGEPASYRGIRARATDGVVVSGWVQSFYAWRIYELSRHARPWNWASGLVILVRSQATRSNAV